jgi:hypothetical protein
MVEASYRGILLKVPDAPSIGAMMKLRVQLPARAVDLHAVAVRTVEFGHSFLVGCRLFALNGPDKEAWQGHIAGVLNSSERAA